MSRISGSYKSKRSDSGWQDFEITQKVGNKEVILPFKKWTPENYADMADTCDSINVIMNDGDVDSAVKAQAEVLHQALLSHDDWTESELSPNRKGTGYVIRKEPSSAIIGEDVSVFISAFADALSIKKE